MVDQVEAGDICAVTGLAHSYAGQGVGNELQGIKPVLLPVLNYQILIPPQIDQSKMLRNLRILEEEMPELHILWNEKSNEIHAQVMGEIQVEILKSLIEDRFQVQVTFGEGSIVYKETIKDMVIGIGHYEPLRHYAEVQLKLEPGELGSGIVITTECLEEDLERNWQRLIMAHVEEKIHIGVLTGSEITDMKVTLIAGKAHLKHTEGGDFRQATYRAIRQGLRKAQSSLLEPFYEFQLEIPSTCIGRAITDIQRMSGTFEEPLTYGENAIIKGTAPVATMNGYQSQVNSYTKGMGHFTCAIKGYDCCHNSLEVRSEERRVGKEC